MIQVKLSFLWGCAKYQSIHGLFKCCSDVPSAGQVYVMGQALASLQRLKHDSDHVGSLEAQLLCHYQSQLEEQHASWGTAVVSLPVTAGATTCFLRRSCSVITSHSWSNNMLLEAQLLCHNQSQLEEQHVFWGTAVVTLSVTTGATTCFLRLYTCCWDKKLVVIVFVVFQRNHIICNTFSAQGRLHEKVTGLFLSISSTNIISGDVRRWLCSAFLQCF
jgi:hypothetical protein